MVGADAAFWRPVLSKRFGVGSTGAFLFVLRLLHLKQFISIPEQDMYACGGFFGGRRKIAIGHYSRHHSAIITGAGMRLLYSMVPDVIRITFTLNCICHAVFFSEHINSVITAGLCDLHIFKTILPEKLCAIVFKLVPVHCIQAESLRRG